MICGLILAAGASTRLGQPKQLVEFQGQCLLNRCIDQLQKACDRVYVVTGFEQQKMEAAVQGALTIHNPNWANGMGTSLPTEHTRALAKRF